MKSVILVGRGPSWIDCPFDAETWGVLSCYSVPGLRDKHFDKVFCFDPPDEELKAGIQLATERGVPIVGVDAYSAGQYSPYSTEQYPLSEVLDKLHRQGYLQNSICHMIAMAILQGYEKLRLYGIDQYRGVYLLQKGAVEFWCGVAVGSCTKRMSCPDFCPTKLEVAPSSMLLSEYLREVAATIGAGDDEQFTTLQEVMPFLGKQPILAYPVKAESHPTTPLVKKVPLSSSLPLYAFYDLEVSPATFDFVKFLVLAEKRRQERGCSDLRVVIVPASGGFRRGDLESYQSFGRYDQSYMEWRLRNILVPCCWLMPSTKGVTVCGDREEARKIMDNQDGYLYPEGYGLDRPVGRFLDGFIQGEEGKLPSLKATPQALDYVGQWLKERTGSLKVVTLNLRETTYEPERNSNIGEWRKVYRWLAHEGYAPIMLPDMEQAFQRGDGFRTYPEVVWNVELRQALYELSYLNLFVNTGQVALALYDENVKCLVFKMLSPGSRATSEQFFSGNGLKLGSQWRHATPSQRIVWADDRMETIVAGFKALSELVPIRQSEERRKEALV